VNYPEPVAVAGPIAQVAVGTAVAGLATGLLGASVGISTGNLTAGILIRGVLTLVLVLLICRAVGARRVRAARPTLVAGALLGFLLDPLTWEARTALTQLAADPGPITLIGDLLLWLSAAALGTELGLRSVAGPAPATTPYG
jgi:hypothetical protein